MSARFSIIPARAIDDTRLSRGALLVLCALGTYGDKNGWCWPSQGEIARRIRLHRTNVSRYIADLERLGYIEKRRQSEEGKGEVNSLYRVIFDGDLPPEFDLERTPPVRPERTPPVRSGRTRTSHGTPQGNGPRERGAGGARTTPIAPDWKPAESTYALLARHGIDRAFAEACIDEFILYWTERQEQRPGWEATFVNSVKRSWERQPARPPHPGPDPRRCPPDAPAFHHPDRDKFDAILQDLQRPVIEGEVIHEHR